MYYIDLPAPLREALSSPDPVVTCAEVNNLCSAIAKLQEEDIQSFRGEVPIAYNYELGLYPEGAAIRLYLAIYDKPDNPYSLEIFLFPDDPADLVLLQKLVDQELLAIHFYNLALAHRLSKAVRHGHQQRQQLARLIYLALAHLAGIEQVDRQAVKRQFQQDRPMDIGGDYEKT